MTPSDTLQGATVVLLSALVLAALVPRLIGPALRAIGDGGAVEALCAPPEWENRTLATIVAFTIGALAWSLSAFSGPYSFLWNLAAVAEPLGNLLLIAGTVAGVVMFIGICQRVADRAFGDGLVTLGCLAAVLSGLLVFARGYSPFWLAVCFPVSVLIGWMTRRFKHAAWKITSAVTAPITAIVMLRNLGQLLE